MTEWLLITIVVFASGEPQAQKRVVLFPTEQSCLAEIAKRKVAQRDLPAGVAAIDWKCMGKPN